MKIIFTVVAVFILCFIWSLIEAQLLRIKKIHINSAKVTESFRIAFLSDIHFGCYNNKCRLKKIVETTNELQPDIVILGGDFLRFKERAKLNPKSLKTLLSVLRGLKAGCGVFSVLGNHDYYLKKDMSTLIEGLRQSGNLILRNDTFGINIGKDAILLHGVEDIKEGKVDVGSLSFDREKFNILISHNPDFFEQYDVEYDLGLSGHTHGGQVNVFGLYAPITNSNYGQKYIHSINRKGKSIIITSKGLGCSDLPIRFFAMPEIIVLDIEP